jgi:L-histidine N-alpha-methyltransferase
MLEAEACHGSAPNLTFHDYAPPTDDFLSAVLRGLSATPRSIPCRFLYDARGSALFDAICRQPEYYPTRTELGILTRHAQEMAELIGPDAELIELGSGSSAKVGLLLDAMTRPAAYAPIDISREHLLDAARRIACERPRLPVHALCADYGTAFALPRFETNGRRVAFFPGSTIGNFTPVEAQAFLAGWAERLGAGAAMLIGVDLKKDTAVLDAAYDDAAGVTAAFSLNLLARANRELGSDFTLSAFRHRARYLKDEGRVAIHLISLADQVATVGDQSFHFGLGEAVHVEDSWKYAVPEFQALARRAGYQPAAVWTDPNHLFSVHLLEVDA